MATDEEFAQVIENRFTDAEMGREVRVVREVRGAEGRTFIEIQDGDGIWRDMKELREMYLD